MHGKDILVTAVSKVHLYLGAALEVDPLDGQAAEGVLLRPVVVEAGLRAVRTREHAPPLLPALESHTGHKGGIWLY